MPSEVRYAQVKRMLESRGYALHRVRGSHHVFKKPGVATFVVPVHHGKVKHAYVRQIETLP
jgi:predicted RNA binding protein YcfA (HicA-like mRNA interferase family)